MNTDSDSSCCHTDHPDHSAELNRLNRISGQIEGIKKMIAERRYCPDIITQLRAIQSAARSVETNILQTHLKSCVQDAMTQEDSNHTEHKIDELVALFKRYD